MIIQVVPFHRSSLPNLACNFQPTEFPTEFTSAPKPATSKPTRRTRKPIRYKDDDDDKYPVYGHKPDGGNHKPSGNHKPDGGHKEDDDGSNDDNAIVHSKAGKKGGKSGKGSKANHSGKGSKANHSGKGKKDNSTKAKGSKGEDKDGKASKTHWSKDGKRLFKGPRNVPSTTGTEELI
jgi:hypothetical protein